jgi:hypothetical protein
MANILEKYGIKEVADVTFYEIEDDGSRGAPALYLDTLKVSTIEQTAEEAEARGGKGNPLLIVWDHGKEINVTLEDALFSAKSMSVMFGGGAKSKDITSVVRTFPASRVSAEGKVVERGVELTLTTPTYYNADGTEGEEGSADYVTGTVAVTGREIEISADTFPGTYYITGDTYARSSVTGKDEFFQFIIPKAKVQSENSITLEAEGDPSVFNMSLRVLRPDDGVMMKLVQYEIPLGEEEIEPTDPDENPGEDN